MRKRIKKPVKKVIKIVKDDIGEHEQIKMSSGIKVNLLKKPSDEYKKLKKKNAEKMAEFEKETQKKREVDKLINDRMREIAIRELKKEGKI